MEVQTEFDGMEILREIDLHELSKDTASILYVLSLGNSKEHFQLRHLRGNFDDFEIEPKQDLGVWGWRKLDDDVVAEMIEDGLLQDVGGKNSKYAITDKGQKILNLYCLGVKILSLELMAKAGQLFVNADALHKSEAWNFETSDFIENEKQAKKYEEILRRMKERAGKMPELTSQVSEEFKKTQSKFHSDRESRKYLQAYITQEIVHFTAKKYFSNFESEVNSNLQKRFKEVVTSIEGPEEVKYYEDVLSMIRNENNPQPEGVRVNSEDEEGEEFILTLEEAHKVEGVSEEAKEVLEQIQAEKDFEEIKDQIGLN